MTSLRQRLTRLEAAQPGLAAPLAIVIMAYGTQDHISALVHGDIQVTRCVGESLDALSTRAENFHPGEVRIWTALSQATMAK
jgi:hypothetical protein